MTSPRSTLLAVVVAVVANAGCGSASPPAATTERFSAPEAQAARERAPDMYAAAQRAREQAEQARARGDERAAQDHDTRARLLLSAAIAESDRLELEERRLELEARATELEEQAARDAHARVEIDAEMERRAAARVAAHEASLAFERAEEDEPRRYRAQADERTRMHREAADVLLQRARLLSSAAEAMGAGAERIRAVTDAIEETERIDDPERRLGAAQDALFGALAAIGEARAASEGPSADESAALLSQAREMGLEVQQRDRGLTVVIEGAFRGTAGTRLRGSAGGTLEKVAALLEAHPHGPVQVHGFGVGRAARRVADARANAVVQALVRAGASRDRLSPEGVVDVEPDAAGSAEVVLNAYGPVDRPSAPPAAAAQPR